MSQISLLQRLDSNNLGAKKLLGSIHSLLFLVQNRSVSEVLLLLLQDQLVGVEEPDGSSFLQSSSGVQRHVVDVVSSFAEVCRTDSQSNLQCLSSLQQRIPLPHCSGFYLAPRGW